MNFGILNYTHENDKICKMLIFDSSRVPSDTYEIFKFNQMN